MNVPFLHLIIFYFGITYVFFFSSESIHNSNNSIKDKIKNIIIDTSFNYLNNKDNYSICKIKIKDSLITITFKANVCDPKKVDLVYNGMILKSLPPKVQVGLRFEPENCRKKRITKTFNISSLKQKNTKKIILLFPNYKSIEFNY